MAYTGPGPGDKNSTRRQLLLLLKQTSIVGTGLVTACRLAGGISGEQVSQRSVSCRSKLEFWSVFGSGTVQYQGIEQLIKAFPASRANCDIEIVVVPSSEIQQKLIVVQASGTPPALATLPPSWVSSWSVQGILASIDDLFKRDKLNSADFPAPLWKQMSYGGRVWFMPLFANADFVLHWNKGHFRDAGLNPERGPETIAELDMMIQQLTREQGGELERLGMQPWDLYGHGNTIQAWGYAFGGSFYDEAKDELTFTHPRILRAVEWYTGWAQRLGVERVNRLRQASILPGGIHFFATGRFSIHPLTSPVLRGVQQYDRRLEIGAGPMPGEPPGQPGSVAIGGWATGAIAGGKQREEAWDFMRYVGADAEGTTIVARFIGIPGWLKSPGLDELSKDPLQKAYVDGVRRAQFVQIGFYSPAGYDLNPIQEVIDGKRGVRDALEAINRDANVRYQEWKRQVKKGV